MPCVNFGRILENFDEQFFSRICGIRSRVLKFYFIFLRTKNQRPTKSKEMEKEDGEEHGGSRVRV